MSETNLQHYYPGRSIESMQCYRERTRVADPTDAYYCMDCEQCPLNEKCTDMEGKTCWDTFRIWAEKPYEEALVSEEQNFEARR